MARSQAQDVIRCQYCEDEPAVYHCVEMNSVLDVKYSILKAKFRPDTRSSVCPTDFIQPIRSKCVKSTHLKRTKLVVTIAKSLVCIMCIQEVHGKHAIGKLQDLYEKQKAETEDELSKMKTQCKSEIIQKIKDLKNGKREIKACHKDIREKMKKQAQDFIDHMRVILKEALDESSKDEREKIMELSQYTAEAERFEQNLDQLIEKFETLTESSHPSDLILYRKEYPDTFKRLKFPGKINFTMPSFTIGQINKSQNEHQFGKFTSGHIIHHKLGDCILQAKYSTQSTGSASIRPSIKKVSGHSVKISETKTCRKKLYEVSCRDDRSAYISGQGPGIQLIDRSGTELDNISTDTQPTGLAVMKDGSLIYSDYDNKVIYRVSLSKQKTRLINTEYYPRGLCCTRTGDILVGMGLFKTARVVKYSSSGGKIQEFITDQSGERLFFIPSFICENVNDDICVSDCGRNSKVVVLDESGNLRFTYDGKVLTRTLKDRFDPRGVATDSLGHILVADNDNKAIHLISQDGDFLSFILTEDDGISLPFGISVDTSNNLWLVENENTCVKVYQYLSLI